jgi:hypothetical protein
VTNGQHYTHLIGQLDSLRQNWRRHRTLEGSLLTLGLTLAAVIVVVAVDGVLRLGTTGRLILAAALWGTLAMAVLRFLVRGWLEDHRDDFFAAMVEERHPELRNRLINALQLGRGTSYGSSLLVEAIVHEGSTAVADVEVVECLDKHPTRRSGMWATAAAGLVVLCVVLVPARFGVSLARVLLPLANIEPYTATRIVEDSIRPGAARVPEGAAVTIDVRVEGVVPATVRLYRSTGDPDRPLAMKPAGPAGDTFRALIPEVGTSFRYHITAGDDRSQGYEVEVVKRPRIESIALTAELPAYAEQSPRRTDRSDGEVSGIAGTRIAMELRATKPLREASLVTETGQVLKFAKTDDDSCWRTSFVLWTDQAKTTAPPSGQTIAAPTRYQLKLLDTDGYENKDPLWQSMSLVKDQPPTVVVTQPGRDLQLKPADALAIRVDAKDDFGLGDVRIEYRVNDEESVRELVRFAHDGPAKPETTDEFKWELARHGLRSGDRVQYWATASDRDIITGPGVTQSRRFSIFVLAPETVVAKLDVQIDDYAQALEELVRLQRENRAQTASGVAFANLVTRETLIRLRTHQLARAMEKDAFPARTFVTTLDDLYAGLMADAIGALEAGQQSREQDKAAAAREKSLPIQDKIIAALQELLERLQKNEQAKNALRKLAKTDQPSHQKIAEALSQLTKDLNRLMTDESELVDKFEKLPKKPVEELSEEQLKALEKFDDLVEKWGKWAKGSVDELTKLPTGFIDDFGLREDVNSVFEEIEKAASRPKAEKLEVALEDLGAALATEMLEDLEIWLPDASDSVQWVQEEPLTNKPMSIPEMPLPDAMEDMIGDLLADAEEFDEEADDITSAWGDNLNQAGWGTSDGPISNFSAKGVTGNDLPNNHEVTGRAGDGRRGKSTGQMVGDTARGLDGRKTPARVTAERYEPGQLKEEGRLDPNGATGGGKKAGAGRRGLQGGTPPDFQRDMERLTEKQANIRDRAEQVAKQLETSGITTRRLTETIELMKSAEKDLRDLRYEDAARKRRVSISELKISLTGLDQATAVQLSRARELPPEMREELLQSADEAYPEGYESLLKSYFRALSEAEK